MMEECTDRIQRICEGKNLSDHDGRHPDRPAVLLEGRDAAQVNPYAIAGGFIRYCIRQGWIVHEGTGRSSKFYVTDSGRQELRRFGIRTGES